MKVNGFLSRKLNSKPENKNSSQTAIALLSGFTGGVISLVGQFFINYQYIEKPKINLEHTKQELEVFKSIQSLRPRGKLTCRTDPVSSVRFQVICDFMNTGTYDAVVHITSFALYKSGIDDRVGDSEHRVKLRDENISSIAEPGGSIRFFFDAEITERTLKALKGAEFYRASYVYRMQTEESYTMQLQQIMPRFEGLISSLSRREEGRMLDFNPSSWWTEK